ncbi:hypothetical protein CKAN_00209400 [Cinnamomum micranthum f. kanehirae]|uniref:DUF1680 domain-containing protein n=1 Tax=Cinnamomum micranthum f. kanehirae TaxID=337451 RepID=A0A443N5K6_9MAGN|nr:hypothetical protein CKAN_00209400 [Cinnamomum micranthum f. kanehirae]
MELLKLFQITIFISAISTSVFAKECTNTPPYLSSHTLRFELQSSSNQSWKQQPHDHLIPTDDSAWSQLLPQRKILKDDKAREELNWAMLYRKIKNSGSGGSTASWVAGDFLKEVPLHDVRLEPDSMHGRAQQTNLEYLLMLDVDSLVWSFRKTADLEAPGSPYGGWEKPTCELRGHFVGHYMSASAQMWASTHNRTLYKKMSAVVSALDDCQKKMGTGYLSAFPSEQFDRFEAIEPVWAPYYTIHKIMAGLLDQYLLAGSTQALKMVVWMAEYFSNRVQNVILKYSLERHWMSLNEETGGMNDVLYKLYSITGDEKHLVLAHLFDKPCFLGLLAVQADSISDFHSNTHIPVVIGSQMRYEEISTFFMNIVNSSHSYATGGTSVSEFWSDPKRLADTLKTENQESCTTYNMLKVARHLFRWTKEMAYADYYERALTNGVLGIQRGMEPGVMIYMLPLGHGKSKARSYHSWGTKFDSFWCCYGTGVESFSKLGDSIYFEKGGNVPSLYIIQFISSSLNWRSGRIVLNQKVEPVVSWDPYLRVSLSFSAKEGFGQLSALYLRIPFWTYSKGAKATLNGDFLSVTKKWNSSDKFALQLPVGLRTETIEDDRPEFSSLQAILFGPYVLAGLTDGDWDIKPGTSKSLSDWITAIPPTYNSQLVSLTQESNTTNLVLTNSENLITMERVPESGTDAAVHATFRLVLKGANSSHISSKRDILGKSVMLEPFDLPQVVVQKGPNDSLVITTSRGGVDPDDYKSSSVFRVIAGLDGEAATISLELESQPGCFVHTGVDYSSGESVRLRCQQEVARMDAEFRRAASFKLDRGLSEYHPISFVAKGERRNFLLMPLLSLRDESYTVYFDVEASILAGGSASHARQVI